MWNYDCVYYYYYYYYYYNYNVIDMEGLGVCVSIFFVHFLIYAISGGGDLHSPGHK